MIHKSQNGSVRKAIAWLMLGIAGGLMLDLFARELARSYSLSTAS